MPSVIKRGILAVLFLVCGACARFENPLVAEEGPQFDEGLTGHWYAESPDGRFEMLIERKGDAGRVLATEFETGKEPSTDELSLITARIGQQTFASVAGVDENSNWVLFRYELATPDRLILYQDEDRVWSDAMRDKLIPGSDQTGRIRNSTVTASSEELRAFVLGYGSVIFKDQPAAEFTRLPVN
jgi:hypothetical protein